MQWSKDHVVGFVSLMSSPAALHKKLASVYHSITSCLLIVASIVYRLSCSIIFVWELDCVCSLISGGCLVPLEKAKSVFVV